MPYRIYYISGKIPFSSANVLDTFIMRSVAAKSRLILLYVQLSKIVKI